MYFPEGAIVDLSKFDSIELLRNDDTKTAQMVGCIMPTFTMPNGHAEIIACYDMEKRPEDASKDINGITNMIADRRKVMRVQGQHPRKFANNPVSDTWPAAERKIVRIVDGRMDQKDADALIGRRVIKIDRAEGIVALITEGE